MHVLSSLPACLGLLAVLAAALAAALTDTLAAALADTLADTSFCSRSKSIMRSAISIECAGVRLRVFNTALTLR